jgi:hypothetical protein
MSKEYLTPPLQYISREILEADAEEYKRFEDMYPEYVYYLFANKEEISEGDAQQFFTFYFPIRSNEVIIHLSRKERKRWVETKDMREKAMLRLQHIFPEIYQSFLEDDNEREEWEMYWRHTTEEFREILTRCYILEQSTKI